MNPFEELASKQIANPVKSRLKAVETRRTRSAEAEKKLAEGDRLLKLYKGEQKRQLQALLNGPFGRDVRGLLQFMRTMTLESAPALVALVKSVAWVRALPEDHKHILLRLISSGIAQVREKNGLPPFDDEIFGQQPKAFSQIKSVVGVR